MTGKKENNQEEPLKLIRWAKDGYPPIDLNQNLRHVIAIINEVRKLRGEFKKEND